jgi:hypothetical protein
MGTPNFSIPLAALEQRAKQLFDSAPQGFLASTSSPSTSPTPTDAAPKSVPFRLQVLSTASSLTSEDRAQVYGDSDINMACYGELVKWWVRWHGLLESKCVGHDAAVLMVLAKLSRVAVGRFHHDNYIDAAAYIAIAAQAEHSERNNQGGANSVSG